MQVRPTAAAMGPRAEPVAAREMRALAAETRDAPERLQEACTALADTLAALHLELAERWLRKGQEPQAVAAFEKLIRCFPDSRPARQAQERLRQLAQPPAAGEA